MSGPIDYLAGLNHFVYQPVRLTILTVLSSCDSANHVMLRGIVALTTGNLSSHLAKLEDAGLVEIKKGFEGKIPYTRIVITEAGRAAVGRHWSELEKLKESCERIEPDGSEYAG